MTMTTEAPTIPDLADPQTFVDGVPHQAFDEIREQPGLYWQPADEGTLKGGFWVATRFADIQTVEANTEQVTSQLGFNYPLPSLTETPEAYEVSRTNNLMRLDPPNHSRVRRVAAASFSPRVVARFDDWIREIVNEALDDALPKGEFDWVKDVAKYIPSRVVAQVLGVPKERRQDIVDWTDAIFEATMDKENGGNRVLEIAQNVFVYAEELRQQKLREPGDDMASTLAQAVERGEITVYEYLFYFSLLLVAGYETTHTFMGQAMRMIVEDPKIAALSEELITTGDSARLSEEFLRHITPAMNMARIATADFEVAGTTVRKDDMVQLMFVAANRDPAVFSNPHGFDPRRTETETLAFGSGVHRCIGNALAKLELRILFEQLQARGVKLALNGEPRRGWSTWINQLFELPVKVVS